jgi:hypothetical protein
MYSLEPLMFILFDVCQGLPFHVFLQQTHFLTVMLQGLGAFRVFFLHFFEIWHVGLDLTLHLLSQREGLL